MTGAGSGWFSSFEAWLQEGWNGPLLVVLLLLGWLWLLVRRREEEERHAQRPTPLSVHELGHCLFLALQGRDPRRYRELFLTGGEARRLLGDDAAAYLEARTGPRVIEAFEGLRGAVPRGSVYQGMKALGDDRWALRFARPDGSTREVPVGTLVQVGTAWRIFAPPPPSEGDAPAGGAVE